MTQWCRAGAGHHSPTQSCGHGTSRESIPPSSGGRQTAMETLSLKQLKIAFLSPKCQFKKAAFRAPLGWQGALEMLRGRPCCPVGQRAAGWKAEPSLRVQVERGQCWHGGTLAQPWGCAVPWLGAAEGHRWAVGCWKGSTDLVCLPCPEHPRSTQPPLQGLQASARVLLAWGLRGLGEEPWVRTSAPSPAPLCSLALPRCCVSLSRGHAPHYSSAVINSSKHSRCFQAQVHFGGDSCHLKHLSPLGVLSPSPSCAGCVCGAPG